MERHVYLRSIAIPPELHLTYTGSFAKDSLPLLTMASALPVIYLYWSLRRYTNMVSIAGSAEHLQIALQGAGHVICCLITNKSPLHRYSSPLAGGLLYYITVSQVQVSI